MGTKVNRIKAIAVARDILANIENINFGHSYFSNLQEFYGPMQPQINAIRDSCTVCAIGAMVLTYAKLYNELSIEDICTCPAYIKYGNLYKILKNILSHDEISWIECIYEQWYTSLPEDTESRLAEFRHNLTDTEIIKKICNNIIANNGHFVP